MGQCLSREDVAACTRKFPNGGCFTRAPGERDPSCSAPCCASERDKFDGDMSTKPAGLDDPFLLEDDDANHGSAKAEWSEVDSCNPASSNADVGSFSTSAGSALHTGPPSMISTWRSEDRAPATKRDDGSPARPADYHAYLLAPDGGAVRPTSEGVKPVGVLDPLVQAMTEDSSPDLRTHFRFPPPVLQPQAAVPPEAVRIEGVASEPSVMPAQHFPPTGRRYHGGGSNVTLPPVEASEPAPPARPRNASDGPFVWPQFEPARSRLSSGGRSDITVDPNSSDTGGRPSSPMYRSASDKPWRQISAPFDAHHQSLIPVRGHQRALSPYRRDHGYDVLRMPSAPGAAPAVTSVPLVFTRQSIGASLGAGPLLSPPIPAWRTATNFLPMPSPPTRLINANGQWASMPNPQQGLGPLGSPQTGSPPLSTPVGSLGPTPLASPLRGPTPMASPQRSPRRLVS